MKKQKNVIIGNSGLIKSMNKKVVLDLIMGGGPISRTEISDLSGLAMPTVMRVVDSFIEEGMVEEVGKGDSTGGRKPVLLSVNPNTYYFLGTDVSGSIRSVVADIHGRILGYEKRTSDYSDGMEGILEQIKSCMDEAIRLSGVDRSRIVYSGIGTPGMGFKYTHSSDKFSFEYWSNTAVDYLMEKAAFDYPTAFENTARLGALGELKFGIGKYVDNFVFIHADHGIGMGLVSGGRLELGTTGVAGEFGHTCVNIFGQDCYCGNKGCIEMYCSMSAMLGDYRAALLNAGEYARVNGNMLTFNELLQAANRREPIAEGVIRRAGAILGIGIGNLINLYNPQAVVFGGELAYLSPLYVKSAEEESRRRIFMNAARGVKYYTTCIETMPASLGAVSLAIRNFIDRFCESSPAEK